MHAMLLEEIAKLNRELAEKDKVIQELKGRCLPDRYQITKTDYTSLNIEKADAVLSSIWWLPYTQLTLIYDRKSDSFSCEDIVYKSNLTPTEKNCIHYYHSRDQIIEGNKGKYILITPNNNVGQMFPSYDAAKAMRESYPEGETIIIEI